MRRIRTIRWQSIYGYLALVVFVLALAAAFVYLQASALYQSQTESALIALAQRAVDHQAMFAPWEKGAAELETALAQLEDLTGAEVVPFGPEGAALAAASPAAPDAGEQVQGPEVRAALNGESGADRRQDASGATSYYVAVPVHDGEDLIGAFQFGFPVPELETTLAHLRTWLMLAFLFAATSVSVIMTVQFLRGAHKLQLLVDMVERITKGDLDTRVLTLYRGEIGRLASALNRMADKLQSQTRKRRREKDRLNTVLQTMNDGIVILNRRGEVSAMNPAAATILDAPLRRSYKRSFVQVARDFRIAAVWDRCLKTNSEQSATIDLANETSVHIVITPFLKRRARGYLVMIRDLTQLRHLQTVRQDFVSNVSHELRTPLASLRALVETLRDGALDDPPAAIRFLDRMEVEVDALTQMVQELMELSRIESGQVPLQRRPVSPQEVVIPAVDRLRAQAERAGLDLSVDIAADAPAVMADAERISQVVTNLVHNAIKFTPSGGRINVRAAQDGEVVRITVHDTGIGISPQDLERVFERFYKADRSRAIGGTGLGLSIASHVVQAHGGEIWADSVEEEWSEFGFSLPLADDPQPLADTANRGDMDEPAQPPAEAAAGSDTGSGADSNGFDTVPSSDAAQSPTIGP